MALVIQDADISKSAPKLGYNPIDILLRVSLGLGLTFMLIKLVSKKHSKTNAEMKETLVSGNA